VDKLVKMLQKLEVRGLLDRKIGGFCSVENLGDIILEALAGLKNI
jgi:hypothetical protein